MIATLPRRAPARARRHRAQQDARRADRARHPHRHHRGRHRHRGRRRAPRTRSPTRSTASRRTPSTSPRSRRRRRARERRPRAGSPRTTDAPSRARRSASPGVAPWLSTPGQIVYGDKNWSTTLIGTGALVLPDPPLHDRERRDLDRERRDLQDEGLRHRADGRRRTSSAPPIRSAARSASAARPYTRHRRARVARDVVLRRRPGRLAHDADRLVPRARHAHVARPRRPAHRQRDERSDDRARQGADRGHPPPAPPHRAGARRLRRELAGRAPADDGRDPGDGHDADVRRRRWSACSSAASA